MKMDFNFFMNDVVKTARDEITSAGYTELKTAEEVDDVLSQKGTTLVMINSVCGCAGGIARPAASSAVHHDKRPVQICNSICWSRQRSDYSCT